MKSIRFTLALFVASFTLAGLVRADEAKPESKPASCCAKAASNDKVCTHGCCVSAAKESKNCGKCGGTNEAKTETQTAS